MSTPKKRRLFYFTPEQERQFNLVTVPGTNVNSNVTVGENARKTGVQALNFLAQEAARKDAEIESRSERKTVKRLTTVGERLRGDNGYSSHMSGGTGMSGRDPLLGTIFDWTVGAKGIDALGKTALWNFAKYGPSNLFRGLARNYFVNNAFKLELRKPILFGVGETLQPQIRTKIGDVEVNNPGLNYRVGTKEIIKDFQNSGVVRAGEVNSQKPNRAGRFLLTKQTFLAPMFKLGSLWYQPSEEMNGLLVTSEPLVVANKYASPVANKGIFTIEGKTFANDFGGRRIPAEGLILNKSNTVAYTWSPGYGYKLVVKEPSTSLAFFERNPSRISEVGRPGNGKTPTITAENAASMTPEQWTSAQDAAITRGDMTEAQRLRDLHFETKDPQASKGLFSHATPYNTPEFNSFDLTRTGLNYPLSKRFGKNVAFFSEEYDPTGFGAQWSLWGDKYRLFKLGSKGSERLNFPEAEVIVDNPNQIKLADAVTYDDNGVRIPLGKRDNFNINDIRYGLFPFLGLGTASALYSKKQGGKITINNTDI